MGRNRQVVLLGVFVALLASPARPGDFQVVAHPTVEGTKIRRSVLAEIYQKDIIRWGNQVRILPVDQSTRSPLRQAFTRDILGLSLGEIQNYWTQRMAVDRQLPPPTRASDDEVLAFVASKKGAIGYVSAGVELPDDVKVLILID